MISDLPKLSNMTFVDLSILQTEGRNEHTDNIDVVSTLDMCRELQTLNHANIYQDSSMNKTKQ
jgi:N-acetylmuramic acid 6-phosphate (MurNAc-6-P) etherase